MNSSKHAIIWRFNILDFFSHTFVLIKKEKYLGLSQCLLYKYSHENKENLQNIRKLIDNNKIPKRCVHKKININSCSVIC